MVREGFIKKMIFEQRPKVNEFLTEEGMSPETKCSKVQLAGCLANVP